MGVDEKTLYFPYLMLLSHYIVGLHVRGLELGAFCCGAPVLSHNHVGVLQGMETM